MSNIPEPTMHALVHNSSGLLYGGVLEYSTGKIEMVYPAVLQIQEPTRGRTHGTVQVNIAMVPLFGTPSRIVVHGQFTVIDIRDVEKIVREPIEENYKQYLAKARAGIVLV